MAHSPASSCGATSRRIKPGAGSTTTGSTVVIGGGSSPQVTISSSGGATQTHTPSPPTNSPAPTVTAPESSQQAAEPTTQPSPQPAPKTKAGIAAVAPQANPPKPAAAIAPARTVAGSSDATTSASAVRLSGCQSASGHATITAPALASAEKAWQIARDRYRAGLTNYLGVLNAESQWLAQQRAAVDLQARRATAAVDLATALGGGWQAESARTAAATSTPTP